MTANALVVGPVDVSSPLGGTMLLESLGDLAQALESGSWLEVGLAAFSTVMDTVAAVMDPLGQLIAAGLGWLMEHVEPLKGWLNDLTGDAGAVLGFAGTWENIAAAMAAAADELDRVVRADLAGMSGAAVVAYGRYQGDFASHLRAVAGSSGALASSLRVCSTVVQVVHDLVRDALAELVGAAISWAAEIVLTVGLGTPWVIGQVTSRVSSLATRVGTKVTEVVTSARSLKNLVEALKEALASLARTLRGAKPGGMHSPDAPHAPGTPGTPSPHGPGALFGEGARQGIDPTPDSIQHGTVRMEDHPDFAATIQGLRDRGFQIRETGDSPRVELRRIVGPDGTVLREERSLFAVPGMRYLDLEHEVGHVNQMLDPRRFPDGPPPTRIDVEMPNGQLRQAPNQSGVLTGWQNSIVEYHNRLQEVLWLERRGVPQHLLDEHMSGVQEWAQEYLKKGIKFGRSPSQTAWAQEHFPDLGGLVRQVQETLGTP